MSVSGGRNRHPKPGRLSRYESRPGGWGMDLAFHCPEPWVVEKEGKVEPGAATWAEKAYSFTREFHQGKILGKWWFNGD